jgi:hypothetical protein
VAEKLVTFGDTRDRIGRGFALIWIIMSKTDRKTFVKTTKYALPLVVAVTGHRDLLEQERSGISEAVSSFLSDLMRDFPERRIQVMSPLAEGADRITARVALDLGLELIAPLPMEQSEYRKDFETAASRAEFEEMCLQASQLLVLPAESTDRDRLYAQLGVFLSAHCHMLLAIWDGKLGTALGGTGQVVKFHHDNVMKGYVPPMVTAQQMLVDDESDLVYHIVCSRDREDGKPAAGLEPLETCWFTKDIEKPRSKTLPKQHRRIFRRSNEFSRDAMRFGDRIDAEGWSLVDDASESELPYGAGTIDRLFRAADWMAIHYQRRTLSTLRVAHVLAFLMGLLFILYSDLWAEKHLMSAFLVCFAVAAAVQYLARSRGWHRKYLDYRTLAEGLRVQFYWAAAGVVSDSVARYSHDNYLQAQDAELGWIRNVMRVAGLESGARSKKAEDGLRFVENAWVGGRGHGGQLDYFLTKLGERVRHHRLTERLGRLSLLVSALVVSISVLMGDRLASNMNALLITVMGAMLLIFGIRHAYAHSTAETELIKQFEFMARIYANARSRLDNTSDLDEKRQILLALGKSALSEHAQWIMMHRERSVDQTEIWRMGSGG